MQSNIAELLHQYFELGVAEGREGRNHDTEAGDAQRVLSEIEAEIVALSAAEPVAWRYKFMDGEDWAGLTFVDPTAGQLKHFVVEPLYAAPPAPSVAVKALQQAASDFMHLFIQDGHLTMQDLEDTDLIPAYEKLSAALSAQVQDVATHRHKKRGSEYALLGVGRMQAENWQVSVDGFDQSIDMQEVAVYRSIDDRSIWVRPVGEFNDGRFEPLPTAPAKQEGGHD